MQKYAQIMSQVCIYMPKIYAKICKYKDGFRLLAKHAEICKKYAQYMHLYAIKYAFACKNMLKYAFYMQTYSRNM